MKTNNEIAYNYHEYPDDAVYITLGINAGMATRYFLIDESEPYINNLAFCNVFVNYMKEICKGKYSYNIDRTVTSISYSGKTDSICDDIIELLQNVYHIQLNSELFENIKERTLSNFQKAYKSGAFRGYYKAFEIADLNKGFKLKQLISDIQDISFEQFEKSCHYIVTSSNSNIYINGNIRDLSNEEVAKIEEALSDNGNEIAMAGRIVDPFLREDIHTLEVAREAHNIDVISFCFEPQVAPLERKIYMEIESEKIPFQDKILHLDLLDASLIVNEGELMKLKNYYKRISTKEQFETAKIQVLQRYLSWIEKNPERFGTECVNMKQSGISVETYLNVLENVTYEAYLEATDKYKPMIAEAQVVMRR